MTDRWNDAGASTPTKSILWDSSWPRFVEEPRRSELLRYFEARFGIGLKTFDGFGLLEHPQTLWLLTISPHVEKLKGFRVLNAGIPVLRKPVDHLKPTTTALHVFGATATKNVVYLDRTQLDCLLKENKVASPLPFTPGYVILAYHQHILGCGLYTGKSLVSQIPRSYKPY